VHARTYGLATLRNFVNVDCDCIDLIILGERVDDITLKWLWRTTGHDIRSDVKHPDGIFDVKMNLYEDCFQWSDESFIENNYLETKILTQLILLMKVYKTYIKLFVTTFTFMIIIIFTELFNIKWWWYLHVLLQ